MTYGAVSDGELDFAQMSVDLVDIFTEAASGYLVDFFPICKQQ